MKKTPGQKQIGIEFSADGDNRWYLRSGNGKRICQGCWQGGDARNSAAAFVKHLKDKPIWIK